MFIKSVKSFINNFKFFFKNGKISLIKLKLILIEYLSKEEIPLNKV